MQSRRWNCKTSKGTMWQCPADWREELAVCFPPQQVPLSFDLCAPPSLQTRFFRFRCEQCHTVNILSKQEISPRPPSGLIWQNGHGAVECFHCSPSPRCSVRTWADQGSECCWDGSGKPCVPKANIPTALWCKHLHLKRTCEGRARRGEAYHREQQRTAHPAGNYSCWVSKSSPVTMRAPVSETFSAGVKFRFQLQKQTRTCLN